MACKHKVKPRMHVLKQDGKNRKSWFINNKYATLCDNLGKAETLSIYWHANDFINLCKNYISNKGAKGLRIYLAAYPENESNAPTGWGNQITVIFAPTNGIDGTSADIGDYYIMNEREAAQEIDATTMKSWVDHYQGNQLKNVLNKLHHFPKGDTQSVFYAMDDIQELVSEIECQTVSGVRMFLSAYTDKDNVKTEFYNRLIIQFVLTMQKKGVEIPIYIEEDTDWPNRTDNPRSKHPDFLDNGQLCPPNCPNP